VEKQREAADLVPRGDEDVQGLEVAVQRAMLVDVLQRRSQLLAPWEHDRRLGEE